MSVLCESTRAGVCVAPATHSATYPNGAVYVMCEAHASWLPYLAVVAPLVAS